MSYWVPQQEVPGSLCSRPAALKLVLPFASEPLNPALLEGVARASCSRGYLGWQGHLERHDNSPFGSLAGLKPLRRHRRAAWTLWSYFCVCPCACYYCPCLFEICDGDAGLTISFAPHNGSWGSSFGRIYFAHFFAKAADSLNSLYQILEVPRAFSAGSLWRDVRGHVGNCH